MRKILAIGSALALCTLASTPSFAAELNIKVQVPRIDVAEYHRPYIAIWIENPDQSVNAHLAPLGSDIFLRVRSNPNFHLPTSDVPLILIGNGTGIAGLRALLKARIAAGQRRNWLLFGERNAAHDRFYEADLSSWQAGGLLEKLDLIYSRDQAERRYVQHRLAECAADLRQWIDAGAHIYICGSLEGMAPGVHAALVATLGADVVEALTIEGRYRRDVY